MSAAVQQRARHLLTDACSSGRLDVALAKLDGYCHADVLDVAKPKVTSDTYAGTYASDALLTTATDGFGQTLQTLSDASPRDASDALSDKPDHHPKKKRGHGRDLEDALKLGACLAADEDGGSGSRPGSRISVRPKAEIEEDPEVVAKRLAEWEAKKYAAAIELAAKKERAMELYRKRSEYCEAVLKPMMEKLVSDVSANADERPENPVPLMIELLAEYANKPVKAFKRFTPEARLRKEIKVLQQQVAELERIVDAPYVLEEGSEEETCDEDEEMEPEEVDVSKAAT